jgi:RimJ/RimL family protein N-acetyltransferase
MRSLDHKKELPTRIEAERVYLRSYQAGDGPWLYKVSLKNRDHLSRYESDNFLMNIEDEEKAEAFARELNEDWIKGDCFFIPVFSKDTDEFVAQIYIGPTNRELPEFIVGFIADVDHQRQGYVTEALGAALGFIFNDLQAHRVILECDDTNQRSWEVSERCGFIREGHLRENKRHPGSPISGTYVYSMLKSDFEKLGEVG